jgi:hypothetical protein
LGNSYCRSNLNRHQENMLNHLMDFESLGIDLLFLIQKKLSVSSFFHFRKLFLVFFKWKTSSIIDSISVAIWSSSSSLMSSYTTPFKTKVCSIVCLFVGWLVSKLKFKFGLDSLNSACSDKIFQFRESVHGFLSACFCQHSIFASIIYLFNLYI